MQNSAQSESSNSPPLLCCCESWAGVSTRRLCPMIQPLRGPLPVLHPDTCTLNWTDKQLHLPSSLFPKLPRSLCLKSFILLYVSLVYPSSISFSSLPSPSLPLSISLRPSLSPRAGLPLVYWPSLLGSQHRSAFTERCLPFLGERWVMFSIWCVCCGMCMWWNACFQ